MTNVENLKVVQAVRWLKSSSFIRSLQVGIRHLAECFTSDIWLFWAQISRDQTVKQPCSLASTLGSQVYNYNMPDKKPASCPRKRTLFCPRCIWHPLHTHVHGDGIFITSVELVYALSASMVGIPGVVHGMVTDFK